MIVPDLSGCSGGHSSAAASRAIHARLPSLVLLSLMMLSVAPGVLLAAGTDREVRLREIQQPAPGHSAVGVRFGYLRSHALFGTDGSPVPGNHNYLRQDLSATLDIRYGLSALTSFRFALPVEYPSIQTDESIEPLSNPLPLAGDAEVALRRQLTARVRSPLYGTSLELLARLPSGHTSVDASGSALTTGTGVAEVELGLLWHKAVAGMVTLDVQGRLTQPLSDVVAFTIEVPTGGDGRLFPGQRGQGTVSLGLEPSELMAVSVNGQVTYHGAYYYGGTDTLWWPSRSDQAIPGSEGLFVAAGGQVALHFPHAPLSLLLDAHYLLKGRTIDSFAVLALDRFSPPPGLSGGLSAWLRF